MAGPNGCAKFIVGVDAFGVPDREIFCCGPENIGGESFSFLEDANVCVDYYKMITGREDFCACEISDDFGFEVVGRPDCTEPEEANHYLTDEEAQARLAQIEQESGKEHFIRHSIFLLGRYEVVACPAENEPSLNSIDLPEAQNCPGFKNVSQENAAPTLDIPLIY